MTLNKFFRLIARFVSGATFLSSVTGLMGATTGTITFILTEFSLFRAQDYLPSDLIEIITQAHYWGYMVMLGGIVWSVASLLTYLGFNAASELFYKDQILDSDKADDDWIEPTELY